MLAQGIGPIAARGMKHDLGRFPAQNQSAVPTRLNSAGDFIDAQLAVHQVPARPGVDRPADQCGILQGGEHDDRHAVDEFGKNVQATAPGHGDVQQDDLRRLGSGDLEGCEGVLGLNDVRHRIHAGQHRSKARTHDGVVIHNHDLHVRTSCGAVSDVSGTSSRVRSPTPGSGCDSMLSSASSASARSRMPVRP